MIPPEYILKNEPVLTEAPLLRQILLSAQKIVKNEEALTPALYQEIERAVMQLSEYYKKNNYG